MVVHYIWVGLAVILISTVMAVLSATGVYQRLALIHGLPYTESSIMGLRSAEQERPNPPSADGRSGIPLTSSALPDSESSHRASRYAKLFTISPH
jgi:hypothetical protein